MNSRCRSFANRTVRGSARKPPINPPLIEPRAAGDLATLYKPGSTTYARLKVMTDPEVQRYMLKFWRLFDSSHTGYLPYHEIIAFEVLVCKGARRACDRTSWGFDAARAPRSTVFVD